MSTPNREQAFTLVVVQALEAIMVMSVMAVMEVEVDIVVKGQRITAVHTAAMTIIQPKTVGRVRKSKTNNSKCSHTNMHKMLTVVMLSSAMIVVNPVICAMNGN